MKHAAITEAAIDELVERFYAQVQAHDVLGPIFNSILHGRWPEHLALLKDFWSSVLLASGRYHGRPVQAHFLVQGLEEAHFEVWLGLFRETLDEVFEPAPAEQIHRVARGIGTRMKSVLFARPQEAGWMPIAIRPDL